MHLYNSIMPLSHYYEDSEYIEVGIDEAGRGPMFGPVYAAAVVLPRDGSYKHELMKDSKRFHSHKKICEVADYIKANAVAWAVGSSTAQEIDSLNIRRATHRAMHKAIDSVQEKLKSNDDYLLLVDGNDFTIHTRMVGEMLLPDRSVCIERGDDKYTSIAAASILAKVERDAYVAGLCKSNPDLDSKYGLLSNKGYGTAQHMQGIRDNGITEWHRKKFGLWRGYV